MTCCLQATQQKRLEELKQRETAAAAAEQEVESLLQSLERQKAEVAAAQTKADANAAAAAAARVEAERQANAVAVAQAALAEEHEAVARSAAVYDKRVAECAERELELNEMKEYLVEREQVRMHVVSCSANLDVLMGLFYWGSRLEAMASRSYGFERRKCAWQPRAA
jgi:hypothetical protein